MTVASSTEAQYLSSFFFDSINTDTHVMSPFAFPLFSHEALRTLCRGKRVWISEGDSRVLDQLTAVFSVVEEEASVIERFPGFVGETDQMPGKALKERLRNCPPDLIILAERDYQTSFGLLCATLAQPIPVVLPTGYVVLGAPGALYALQNASGASYASLESMLGAFQGKKILLWNHGPAVHYVLVPALRGLGMDKDIVGIVDADETRQGKELCGFKVSKPEEALDKGGFDVVLAASDAAEAAFSAIHGKTADFTPLLVHRPLSGVLEAFQPLAFSHSLFSGADSVLTRKPEQRTPRPLVMFTKERYDLLCRDHPHHSDEHFEEVTPFVASIMAKCGFFPVDKESRFVNCSDGLRKTAFQPDQWTNRILLFGPSCTFGSYEDDEHTIGSALQRICNEKTADLPKGMVFKVDNYGANASSPDNCFRKFMGQDLIAGDVVIMLIGSYWLRTRPEEMVRLCSSMHQRCLRLGAKFALYVTPELTYVANPSEDEKLMIESYLHLAGEIRLEQAYPACEDRHSATIERLRDAGVHCDSLQAFFDRPHDMGEIFIDTAHVSYKGTALIADVLFKQAVANPPSLLEDTMYGETLKYFAGIVRDFALADGYYVPWMEQIPSPPDWAENVGAVAVNANPFTLGHRYLIEQALKEVDFLYLFVVEEEQPHFSTSNRHAMVAAGIADLEDRVRMISSGRWIGSSFSFPEYFTRERGVYYIPDTTIEGLAFAFLIAPELGIKVRFFGDEPTCTVTRSYQRQVEHMLGLAGLRSRTFPRFERDGKPVSASRVRSLLKDGNFEAIASLVPDGTLKRLASDREDDSCRTA